MALMEESEALRDLPTALALLEGIEAIAGIMAADPQQKQRAEAIAAMVLEAHFILRKIDKEFVQAELTATA